MHSCRLVLLTAIGFVAVSCAPVRTSIVIKQGNPQQFFVSGHGTFDILTVSGPDYERKHDGIPNMHDGLPYMKDYWVIQPVNDLDVSSVTNPIIYGQVPPGFRQYTPVNGPPPPISDGSPYWINFRVRQPDGSVTVFFSVRDGKIVTRPESD
jgi:hypothetical protein